MNGMERVLACAAVFLLGFAVPARATGCGGDSKGPQFSDLRAVVISAMAPTLYDGERDDEALYGMIAEILKDKDEKGLYEVRMQYGYETLIEEAHLRIVSKREAEAWRASVTHQVIAPFADVLPGAATEAYPPVITLPRGAYLKIGAPDAEDPRWVEAELFGGTKGWIRKEMVRPVRRWGSLDETQTRANLIEDARLYLGTSYRWGGKTPYGVDCSGFTAMAYMLNGLDIYRNSQPEVGYPIALMHLAGTSDDRYTPETLARAKPGDLIFWGGHVGFYLGNGKYAHANGSSYDTRINSLLPGDPDYREDLARPSAVYAWGTAYPEEPKAIVVRDFYALPFVSGDVTGYRYYVRADGYTPNRAVLYPEGKDGPAVEIGSTRRMLYDSPKSTHRNVPTYFYGASGSYRPAIVLVNDAGWRPDGKTISSDLVEMAQPIVVP